MGRGIAYPHKHFVLVDVNDIMEELNIGEDWYELQEHLREVMDLEAGQDSNTHVGLKWNSGWNTSVVFELDISGDVPCIYVEDLEYPYFGKFASEYADEEDTVDELVGNWNEYNEWVEETITTAFTELARLHRDHIRVPTSAWTSEPYLLSKGELL